MSDLPAEGDATALSSALASLMRQKKSDERRAQRCLAGPHRDDLVLKAEGVPVASRASSGETRTFLLAWTLAEMTLMAEATRHAPVLVFDDFDSEWDPHVLAAFAEALPEEGQIFLSSARPEAVRGLPLPPGALYRMASGRLAREGILGAGRSATRVARGGCPMSATGPGAARGGVPRAGTQTPATTTAPHRSSSSRGSRPCASGPGCTSGTPTTSRASTTW